MSESIPGGPAPSNPEEPLQPTPSGESPANDIPGLGTIPDEHDTTTDIEHPPATTAPRVRYILLLTGSLCCAGIFLTILGMQLLEKWFGWSGDVLKGMIGATATDQEIWQVRFLATLNQVLTFLLPGTATVYVLRGAAPGIAEGVSLRHFPSFRTIGLSILLLISAMPLVFYSYQINQLVPISEEMKTVSEQANETIKALMRMPDWASFVANLILIAVIPALGEELLFRGIIQRQLMRRMLPWAAILLTGALFSFIHFQMDGFLPRWLLGVLLGWVYWRTNNFWVPVLLHFLNNGFQVLAQYLYGQT